MPEIAFSAGAPPPPGPTLDELSEELDITGSSPSAPRAAIRLSAEDRAALKELGIDPDKALGLSPEVLTRLAAHAKVQKEVEDARKKRRENDLAERRLLDREEVQQGRAERIEAVLRVFEAVPDRLTQRLLDVTDYDEMREAIQAELDAIRREFAR